MKTVFGLLKESLFLIYTTADKSSVFYERLNKMNKSFEKLVTLEKNMGYTYKNKELLKNALTHTSYANEHRLKKELSNERLEFLGDAIVDFVVGHKLFEMCPTKPEGELSKMRAAVVCEQGLKTAADKFGLGEFLLLGKGEESMGGRGRASIVSDAFEALAASIYLDGGFEAARGWVLKMLGDEIDKAAVGRYNKDFKTLLQEYIQQFGSFVRYEVTGERGPEHEKVFEVNVLRNNEVICSGEGKSKKEAEQNAAKKALEIYDRLKNV